MARRLVIVCWPHLGDSHGCGHRAKNAGRARAPVRARISSWPPALSERADVLRLRPLLSLGRVELDLLVLVQRPVAGCRDRGEVDEHVRRPVIGGDETKALVCVEPLHRAWCHVSEVLIRHTTARPRRPRAYPVPGSGGGQKHRWPSVAIADPKSL